MNFQTQKENILNKSTKSFVAKQRPILTSSVELPKNSSAHIAKINGDIETVQLTEKTIVSHLKDCRTILDQIKEKADNSSEELNRVLMDIFKQLLDGFNLQIQSQTVENEKVQKKIEQLKVTKTELQKTVVQYSKHCSQLEEELGRYPS